MTRNSRNRWRMAATGIACAMIFTPAAALAAPTHPAAPQAAAPGCPTSDLKVWVGTPGIAGAGSTGYELELSNISHRTCTLLGYPGVSAVADGSFQQLGSPAARDPGHPTRLVTLGPGATAHVQLRIVNVGMYPPAVCHPAAAIGLKVYPPNEDAERKHRANQR
jgi:hypothetical protein